MSLSVSIRDPWVAVELSIEKVLRSSNKTRKLSADKFYKFYILTAISQRNNLMKSVKIATSVSMKFTFQFV